MQSKICKYIFAFYFIGISLFCCIQIISRAAKPVYKALANVDYSDLRATISEIDDAVNAGLSANYRVATVYGLVQRILGKSEANGVIKDRDGMLHVIDTIPTEEKLLASVDNLERLYLHAEEEKIPLLYVQAPSDILKPQTRLPFGVEDISNPRIDFFLKHLADRGIPALDTRLLFTGIPANEVFYATDHHWTSNAAFTTVGAIIERLNTEHLFILDPSGMVCALDNYDEQVYPRFLGSRGIRVGRYFAGEDRLSILVPRFDTSLCLRYYQDGEVFRETKGDFSQALIDSSALKPNYKNKYNAFLSAIPYEARIDNFLMPEGKRCLLIADSFGRSLAPYLSLCFEQTVLLDPQEERYNEDYISYVDTYRPDVIVVLFNGLSVYTDMTLED